MGIVMVIFRGRWKGIFGDFEVILRIFGTDCEGDLGGDLGGDFDGDGDFDFC